MFPPKTEPGQGRRGGLIFKLNMSRRFCSLYIQTRSCVWNRIKIYKLVDKVPGEGEPFETGVDENRDMPPSSSTLVSKLK